jgi:hypothetical protein
MKRFLVVTTVTFLVVVGATALAAMTSNTIDSNATVAKKGRQVQVTVLLGCDRAQNARLRVTVTQGGGKAAVAQKKKKVICTTATGSFSLKAKARSRHRFAEGTATVCALAVTRDDVKQWCKDVTLVAGGSAKKN